MLKLALIGEGIGQSHSPDLHQRLGRKVGLDVQYDIVDSIHQPEFRFNEAVARLQRDGYRGTNVTYPFKELAAALATVQRPGVRQVGASNTLLFESDGTIVADNTDYTGFISAYRKQFNDRPPGRVLMIGAGGVGRAVACALSELAPEELLIQERDPARAKDLIRIVKSLGVPARSVTPLEADDRLPEWQGIINCTPVGHINHPGCPLHTGGLRSHHWVFDAVYIPARTQLLKAAESCDAATLSGVELFVYQGIDAFRHFAAELIESHLIDPHVNAIRDHYYRQLVLEA